MVFIQFPNFYPAWWKKKTPERSICNIFKRWHIIRYNRRGGIW